MGKITRRRAAELLERAAEVGDRDGWTQRTYLVEDQEFLDMFDLPAGTRIGSRCAVGCMWGAQEELGFSKDVLAVAEGLMADRIDHPQGYSPTDEITCWNDDEGRTWPEVRDAFPHTAKEIRNDSESHQDR